MGYMSDADDVVLQEYGITLCKANALGRYSSLQRLHQYNCSQ